MADINVTEEIIDINVTEEVITIEAPTGAYPFPNAVFSVFGRVGSIVAAEGDYSLTQLSDVTLTSPANGQVLKYNGTSWVNSTDADTGITTLNTLTALSQTFATGTSGTDFNISSASSTHTFNFPTASATNRGLLSSANWSNFNTAYNDSIISAAVTGTTTKTLTLNQQDGGTITASWTDTDTGLTSVGLSMPSAFSVANSPLTANGTLSVTGAGTTAQYIRGDGSLATFPSLTGYVPYTGATTNVNLGTHSLTAADLVINHASGSGVAASITKGGNGEALTVVKSSGSGNAASITGGVTLLSELNLTTDLADSYIASASNWNTAYNNSIISAAVTGTTTKTLTLTQQDAGTITASWTDDNTDAVTSVFGRTGAVVAQSGDYTTTQVTEGTNLYFTDARARAAISLTTTGTSGAATYSGGVLNIPQYQGVLTNPVTGTGTTNTLPKFTGASTIGDSNITDTGSLITLGSNTYISSGGLGMGSTSLTGINLNINRQLTGGTTAWSVYNQSQILSDVTNTAVGFYSAISPTAASFTLSNLRHFYVQPTAFGAGSSVTNQVGYLVSSGMTGATNNYGFQGSLAAATNTWNLYMNGTAENYLAGNIGIGTTTIGASVHIKTALSTASSEEIALRVESTPTGGTPDRSIELSVKNDGTAANTYGILRMGSFATNANTPSTVVLSAGGDSFFRGGGLGIGTAAPSAGPITSITLTNGGSGYVDGTYTNISFTSTGESLYGRATYVVSGGVVTSATLTWGGSNYTAGQTLTTANTNLGGTGSGLVVTVATVDSSQFRIQSTSSTDISLFRYLISASANAPYGSIKWESNDSSEGSSGLQAQIGAYAVGTLGGGYLSFFTRAGSLYAPLVEAMRIDSRGNIGIGATALTRTSLSVSKNITGSTLSIGIGSDGVIQSDVTSQAYYFISEAKTAAASFTLGNIYHYRATQGTFGAGSIVTSQTGFNVDNLTGATNNYGFFGNIASGTNRWNLYMNGSANNYMAGSLAIGTTSFVSGGGTYNLNLAKSITGTVVAGAMNIGGLVQSDVTSAAIGLNVQVTTAAASFTLNQLRHISVNQTTLGAGSSVSNQYGIYVDQITNGSSNFGFFGNVPAQSNTWNLYMAGTANNYMAGSLGIGSTSLTGYSLVVGKNITGSANSQGIRNNGVIQSDVTGYAVMYNSIASTAAASFTNNTLVHYYAQQGTIGAGSAVTFQYGFLAESSMIGATNNYGFYGAIASGTNRWNLYMAGTAANYMAGTLSIGTTSTSYALTVQGAIYANNDGSSVGLYVNSNGAVRGLGTFYIDTALGSNADLIFRPNIAEALRMKPNGNILIGTTTDVASSILTMNSTTKGFLPPRMTTTQKLAIGTPAAGLMVYDTTLNQMSYYNGTTWINF